MSLQLQRQCRPQLTTSSLHSPWPTTPRPNDIRQHSGDTEDNPFFWLLSCDLPEEVIDPDLFDWPEETGLMDGV